MSLPQLFFLFGASLFLTACSSTRHLPQASQASKFPVETWQSAPSGTTTKIRVSTDSPNPNFQKELIQRVIKMGFRLDPAASYGRTIVTKVSPIDNFYMRLQLAFTDTTGIITGQYGNIGLNGVAQGASPSADNISWNDVKPSTRGWERLSAFPSSNSNNKVEYNKYSSTFNK